MVSDRLASIPFYHELLGSLSRSEVLLISAILYAARLHAPDTWFILTDETIATWTGLSRTTIWRCRRSLVRKGLVQIARSEVNFYRITPACEERIMALAGERVKRRDEHVLDQYTPVARELVETYSEATDQRPKLSWSRAFGRMLRIHVKRDEIKAAVRSLRERRARRITPWLVLREIKRARRQAKRKAQPKAASLSHSRNGAISDAYTELVNLLTVEP